MHIKNVLITGATSGIGQATARIFAANGHRLIITGRRKERLTKLAEEIKAQYHVEVLPLVFDVRDYNAVKAAADNLPEDWRSIDVLVNNAGLAVGLNPIQEGVIDDWERMIDTNIKGLLYMTRCFAPLMMANNSGHIINIGSIAGKEVYPNGNVYCATKHAVDALSKAMRTDMLKYGIKVTQIAPGAVETEFSLVRFKGDQEKADNVYKGITPLTGDDIAALIYYVTTLPSHVCINDMVVTPTAQANASIFNRS
ncbi:MAG: SDR family oxidoreductase [Bacteroidota bacterium]|nr:SDR family oxidoreductase [Bacteroidota bacterium]